MNLEIEVCPPRNEVGVCQVQLQGATFGQSPRIWAAQEGHPQLPLRVLVGDTSQGTASRDPGWLYPPMENSSCPWAASSCLYFEAAH